MTQLKQGSLLVFVRVRGRRELLVAVCCMAIGGGRDRGRKVAAVLQQNRRFSNKTQSRYRYSFAAAPVASLSQYNLDFEQPHQLHLLYLISKQTRSKICKTHHLNSQQERYWTSTRSIYRTFKSVSTQWRSRCASSSGSQGGGGAFVLDALLLLLLLLLFMTVAPTSPCVAANHHAPCLSPPCTNLYLHATERPPEGTACGMLLAWRHGGGHAGAGSWRGRQHRLRVQATPCHRHQELQPGSCAPPDSTPHQR